MELIENEVQGCRADESKLAPSPSVSAMKARAEVGSESVYKEDALDYFVPSSPGSASDESDRKSPPGNGNKRGNAASKNDKAFAKKSSPTPFDRSIISKDFSSPNELQPLHFNTREILDETPPIFKSLNSGARGPDTFVYHSSPQNEDPCKTFVIMSENNGTFVKRKNSLNQTPAVNGKSGAPDREQNEYLSYVIEKNAAGDCEKMSEEECGKTGESVDEVDRVTATTCFPNGQSESTECSPDIPQTNESQIRAKEKVQSEEGEKSAEDNTVESFDRTITGKKEQAFAKLQDELEKAHQELKLKDEEVSRLTRIREDVERELEELTASLFQEAHKMVSKAKEKQAAAEKNLKESQMKVEVLTAEVVALKTLVLTSTPSRPNPHLHPQIGKEENVGGVNLFARKHRRSPSHFNLKYGRENSPPESPVKEDQNVAQNSVASSLESRDASEVDPTVHKEFLNWSLKCKLDKTDPFIDRIYREDINLCLDFSNRELAEEIQKAIETRNIFIESVTDKTKTIFPRKCALLEVTRHCHYRMKLGDQDTWYNISQMCRNRIIAVCNFINYLRYIELGLVKSSAHDMYWEIMRLRKEMVLARLGLSQPSS